MDDLQQRTRETVQIDALRNDDEYMILRNRARALCHIACRNGSVLSVIPFVKDDFFLRYNVRIFDQSLVEQNVTTWVMKWIQNVNAMRRGSEWMRRHWLTLLAFFFGPFLLFRKCRIDRVVPLLDFLMQTKSLCLSEVEVLFPTTFFLERIEDIQVPWTVFLLGPYWNHFRSRPLLLAVATRYVDMICESHDTSVVCACAVQVERLGTSVPQLICSSRFVRLYERLRSVDGVVVDALVELLVDWIRCDRQLAIVVDDMLRNGHTMHVRIVDVVRETAPFLRRSGPPNNVALRTLQNDL